MAHAAATTKDIVITRTFNAPLERVWEVWTQPEHLKKWWGPKDFTAPHIKNDLRTGGKYVYCMHGPAGSEWDKDMYSGGMYKEVVPMQKIVASDHFTDEKGNIMSPNEAGMPGQWPEEMEVTVTFEAVGSDKTKLTILHKGHPADFAGMAQQGWSESLDKFEAALR